MTIRLPLAALLCLCLGAMATLSQAAPPSPNRPAADQWRAEHRLIDLHQHIDGTEERITRAVGIMNRAGLGIGVNLSGGTTTHKEGELSSFEKTKGLADRLFPGRFIHYMNLDYTAWNEPDFSARAVKQVEEGHRLGAAGLKEFKRLGLYLRDKDAKLIRIDDPMLDPVWKRCGELGMPISIHVADPVAFWKPYDSSNERWKELKDHRPWWFGDPKLYPSHEELLAALDRVIGRHPETTFVCVHFANHAEDLDWVDKSLDRHPNMMADLAARIPEIGRHDPAAVRKLFIKHQDRIFFATDFQVYERLTLGSGGSGPPPTDEDAAEFYGKHWRWLETRDRNFAHMTPIQGDWTISGIGLPDGVLRKIYFENARRLLARSLPLPRMKARQVVGDFALGGADARRVWADAPATLVERDSLAGRVQAELGTEVRALWSENYLYLRYQGPYTRLTTFTPAMKSGERAGLWDRDVVEAFISDSATDPRSYKEFEVAPTGEKLDLSITPAEKKLEWDSGFTARASHSLFRKTLTVEMKIPLKALSARKPARGTNWRINLYRCDKASNGYLAWSPTLVKTFHAPARFGWLEFE